MKKTICVLMCILTLFSFTNCSHDSIDPDDLYIDAYFYRYPVNLSYDKTTAATSPPRAFGFMEIYEDTFLIYGGEQKLRSKMVSAERTKYAPGIENTILLDGDILAIHFASESREINGMTYKKEKHGDIVDASVAQSNAEEHIRTVISKEKGFDIDISEYEIEVTDHTNSYHFRWEKYMHGVCIHHITINVEKNGKIGDWYSPPFPPQKVLNKIPEVDEEEYIESATIVAERAISNENEEFSLGESKLHEVDLFYSHEHFCYQITYDMSFEVHLPNENEPKKCDLTFILLLDPYV